MRTLLIGLGHRMRQGKDAAAGFIIEATPGLDVRRYSFAQAMKRELNEAVMDCCRLLDVGPERAFLYMCRLFGAVYDPNPPMDDPDCSLGKQRSLLQMYGTQFRRAQDEQYWVSRLAARIMHDAPQVALITDMRFRNEATFVQEGGGYTVNVRRLTAQAPIHGLDEAHVSEHELDGWLYDYQIVADDGDMAGLQRQAVAVFAHIMQRQPRPTVLPIAGPAACQEHPV